MKVCSILIILQLFFSVSWAETSYEATSEQNWLKLSQQVSLWREEERVQGWSYILSGALVTAGSVAGFYSTDDPFGQIVFSVAQGLGLGALGHGLYKVQLGHELGDAFYALEDTPGLTAQQKTDFFYRYQKRWRERQKRQDRIQALVYALGGAAYLYNASKVDAGAPRDLLYGLSALSFALSLKLAF